MPVEKFARVLRVLLMITLGCNIAALFLVPGLVFASPQVWPELLSGWSVRYFLLSWAAVWPDPYTAALTLFLLFSGCCTAVILCQGRRVLDAILRGEPFSMENARSLRRAAVCSFLIALAALVRVVFSVCFFRSLAPLLSYNALFVPIFAMAGLLCLVMAALFRQAAEMKAENDLTI